jgi:hypothetical protein
MFEEQPEEMPSFKRRRTHSIVAPVLLTLLGGVSEQAAAAACSGQEVPCSQGQGVVGSPAGSLPSEQDSSPPAIDSKKRKRAPGWTAVSAAAAASAAAVAARLLLHAGTHAFPKSSCWRAYRYTAAERMDLASKVTNKLERTAVQNYGSHMTKLEVSAVPFVGLISASTAACRPAKLACLQS